MMSSSFKFILAMISLRLGLKRVLFQGQHYISLYISSRDNFIEYSPSNEKVNTRSSYDFTIEVM